MDIEAALRGGDRRSLGRAEEVVQWVLDDRGRLGELFDVVLSDDEIVRMRAVDALEKVCRRHPDWLAPYVDRLLADVARIDQPSVQWHLAQMIGEVDLNGGQRAQAIAVLRHDLEQATDWIVLNCSLEAFARLARSDDDLRAYFVGQLERHARSPHASVAKRAAALLSTF